VPTGSGRTYTPKKAEITHEWFVVDAEGLVLGRMATEVARILRGKHKPTFTPNLDVGDHVVIVNADKVVLTAGKADTKMVRRHSGYPGGLKQKTYGQQLASRPDEAVRRTIAGMLPKNRLGRQLVRKLRVYSGPTHPHVAQSPQPLEIPAARATRARRRPSPTTIPTDDTPLWQPSPDVGVSIRAWEADTTDMTVLELTGGAAGRRIESLQRGLVNVYSADNIDTISWSTSLPASRCMAELETAAKKLRRDAGDEILFGYYQRADWTETALPSKVAFTEISRVLKATESSLVAVAVGESTWVWQAQTLLQSGERVSSFGCETTALDRELLLAVFEATADSAALQMRSAVLTAIRHA